MADRRDSLPFLITDGVNSPYRHGDHTMKSGLKRSLPRRQPGVRPQVPTTTARPHQGWDPTYPRSATAIFRSPRLAFPALKSPAPFLPPPGLPLPLHSTPLPLPVSAPSILTLSATSCSPNGYCAIHSLHLYGQWRRRRRGSRRAEAAAAGPRCRCSTWPRPPRTSSSASSPTRTTTPRSRSTSPRPAAASRCAGSARPGASRRGSRPETPTRRARTSPRLSGGGASAGPRTGGPGCFCPRPPGRHPRARAAGRDGVAAAAVLGGSTRPASRTSSPRWSGRGGRRWRARPRCSWRGTGPATSSSSATWSDQSPCPPAVQAASIIFSTNQAHLMRDDDTYCVRIEYVFIY